MSAQDGDFLGYRDQRVREILCEARASLRARIEESRETIVALQAQIDTIESAAKRGEWWRLTPWLQDSVVESLCECSPVDLLGVES